MKEDLFLNIAYGNERPGPDEKVLKIKDAKKALAAACKRLGFSNFSQRNIRQVLIRRLWKSETDYKLISKRQGHQDGGKLILDAFLPQKIPNTKSSS